MSIDLQERTNAVVKYSNGLNTTALRGFTRVEMDIFWSVLSKMRDKGTAEVTFSFDVFKRLAKYDRREKEGFYKALKSMSEKLGTLTYKFEDKDVYEQLWLFQRFRIDKVEETVTIQANVAFEFILNSLGKHFTRFELDNYTRLRSGYTKELYRYLMQFRQNDYGTGYWVVKMDDFRRALSIPDSYRMTNINKRILDQAKEEFTTPNEKGEVIFESFHVEKFYAKKGNRIDRLKISYQEPQLPRVSTHNYLEN